MNKNFTYIFMTIVACFNGLVGIIISFFPFETAQIFDLTLKEKIQSLPFKALGAAIFGLSVLDYMKRHSKLGGIYEKPTVMSNAIFHAIMGIQLFEISSLEQPTIIIIATTIYLFLATGFVILYFKNPKDLKN